MTTEVVVDDDAWTRALPAAPDLAREASEAAVKAERSRSGSGELSVLLAGDAAVRELNARFRGKDAPTNVLSFPAAPSPAFAGDDGAPPLGDVVLAYGVCAREALEQGKPLAHHLQHLVVHGVLHLLSFDHESDAEAEEMEAVERTVLAKLGVPDPYRLTP